MTVIFHTNAGMPVLAGDMLLSAADPSINTRLRLPSQPTGIATPAGAPPKYVPVSMRRKVFIVNDCMAVGAAGSAEHIGLFIGDLADTFCNRRGFTRYELETFLEKYKVSQHGGEILNQVGAIIIAEATDWRGSLAKGLANRRNVFSKRFGRVVAIGVGADSIVKEIDRLDNNYKYGMSQPSDGETHFPEFETLMANLTLIANVYWREFTSPDIVFEGWGGAYDLIYQDQNKSFRYLEDYTIVLRLFDGERTEKGIQLNERPQV